MKNKQRGFNLLDMTLTLAIMSFWVYLFSIFYQRYVLSLFETLAYRLNHLF